MEDRFRRNVYFATKANIAKNDELLQFGLTNEKLMLNSFADYTRDELFTLRAIIEDAEEEWSNYKVQISSKFITKSQL